MEVSVKMKSNIAVWEIGEKKNGQKDEEIGSLLSLNFPIIAGPMSESLYSLV